MDFVSATQVVLGVEAEARLHECLLLLLRGNRKAVVVQLGRIVSERLPLCRTCSCANKVASGAEKNLFSVEVSGAHSEQKKLADKAVSAELQRVRGSPLSPKKFK